MQNIELPPNLPVTWVSDDRSLIVSVTLDELRAGIGHEAFDAGLMRAVNERLVLQLGAVTDDPADAGDSHSFSVSSDEAWAWANDDPAAPWNAKVGPNDVREALTSPLTSVAGETVPLHQASGERP